MICEGPLPLPDFFIDHVAQLHVAQLQDIIVGIASLWLRLVHAEISWQRTLVSWYRPPRCPPQISNPPSHFLPSFHQCCSWIRAGLVLHWHLTSPQWCNAMQCRVAWFRVGWQSGADFLCATPLGHLSRAPQSDLAQLRAHCSNLNDCAYSTS